MQRPHRPPSRYPTMPTSVLRISPGRWSLGASKVAAPIGPVWWRPSIRRRASRSCRHLRRHQRREKRPLPNPTRLSTTSGPRLRLRSLPKSRQAEAGRFRRVLATGPRKLPKAAQSIAMCCRLTSRPPRRSHRHLRGRDPSRLEPVRYHRRNGPWRLPPTCLPSRRRSRRPLEKQNPQQSLRRRGPSICGPWRRPPSRLAPRSRLHQRPPRSRRANEWALCPHRPSLRRQVRHLSLRRRRSLRSSLPYRHRPRLDRRRRPLLLPTPLPRSLHGRALLSPLLRQPRGSL
jgi:hypothetical protein